jgi:hypothetical protein
MHPVCKVKCSYVDHDFLDGSDATIVMGTDESALLRLWSEKRRDVEPLQLSCGLTTQIRAATTNLNRRCYELNSGNRVTVVRKRFRHRESTWMSATLDGVVESTGAIFEATFLPTWSIVEQKGPDAYLPKLQHKMLVAGRSKSVLSVITGDGKWLGLTIDADPVYQTALIAAEKAFWRSVQTGTPPRLFGIAPRRIRIEGMRVVDMSGAVPRTELDANHAIDKSVLAIAVPRRWRDKNHLKFVAAQPCMVCGRRPCDAHHLRFAQLRALGRKVSDEFTVPLCRTHHRAVHHSGSEERWWREARVDPLGVAQRLWRQSRMRQGRSSGEVGQSECDASRAELSGDQFADGPSTTAGPCDASST